MWADIKCFIFIGICYLGIYTMFFIKWLLTNYRKHISIILICVILASCVSIPAVITTPEAAIAHAATLTIVQAVLHIFIVAGVTWLIVKRTNEFKGCDEPIMPDMVEECNRLKAAEEVRKQSIH